jgi:hypothetical protein
MSIADELAKLEELRRSGALTEAEFASAKKALLAAPAAPAAAPEPALGDHLAAQLDEVRFQNELAQLDREWEIERERYTVAGRYGVRYVPTTGGAAVGGLLVVGFGIIWTIMAFVMAQGGSRFLANHPMAGESESMIPWLFPIFGVLFIVAGVVMTVSAHAKAQKYEQAHAAYQRRRRELLARRGG